MANSTVNILNLDFDSIKQSFIEWLDTQDVEIKDYNYEGSAFNQLLDTLALNTTYEAFYKQMLANEMFLDSAQIRSSVISKAKENGYLPKSARASYINLRIGVTPKNGSTTTLIVTKGTKFYTGSSTGRVSYIPIDDYYLKWDDDEEAYVGNVLVYAGSLYRETYTYEDGDRIYINSDTVDLSTLSVVVSKSRTENEHWSYQYAENVVDIGPKSRAYWLREADLGTYELVFGDGYIGKELEAGNIVTIEYLASNTRAEFGNSYFVADPSFFRGFIHAITTASTTTPYVPVEDTESIRYNALNKKITQDRCVTADDYKSVILEKYPQAIDVVAWGGEDADEPNYGKVFVSVLLPSLGFIPQQDKVAIKNIIKSYNLRNIRPEFVDPEYFRIVVNGYVRVNDKEMTTSQNVLHKEILDLFDTYNKRNLGKFECIFSELDLFDDIKSTSQAINTIVFTFDMKYDCYLYENVVRVIPYRNQIKKGTFISTSFYFQNDTTYPCVINDDTNGYVHVYQFRDGQYKKFKTIGTIDYLNGFVYLDSFYGSAINENDYVTFSVTTVDSRLKSSKNQIFTIDTDESEGFRIQDY